MAKKEIKNIHTIEIQHVWSVLCSNSAVDQVSQNISLFNVVEQVNLVGKEIEAQRKPGEKVMIPINLQLVSFLRKIGSGSFSGLLKMEVVGPRNDILGTGEHEIGFPDSNKDRLRVITNIPGIAVTVDGYYEFRISLRAKDGEYEQIAVVPLKIVFN